MANIKKLASIASKHKMLFWFDACRIYENALMIKLFEDGYAGKSLVDIVLEMCSYADLLTISFKKMFSHLGGTVLVNRKSKKLTAA